MFKAHTMLKSIILKLLMICSFLISIFFGGFGLCKKVNNVFTISFFCSVVFLQNQFLNINIVIVIFYFI